jgi:pilus assembly protein FimV
MQHSPYRFLALHAGGLVLAACLSSTVLAAELGDVVVRSHIGQQLSADIELVMLTPEDQAGVQVKLAGPNVYQGANVRMHPALSSLRMSVVKRDNRQFLHLTTFQPVDAELVHLYFELGAGSRASVRSATLWLTPEPAQPAAPARAPAPAAASLIANTAAGGAANAAAGAGAASSAAARPSGAAQVDAGADLGIPAAPSAAERAAQEAQAAANRAAAMRAARMRAAANAARDSLRDPAGGTASAGPAASAARAATEAGETKPGPAPVPIKLAPEPRVAKGRPGAAKAGVCTPGQSDSEAQQCVALDQTNAELKAKLVDLEGKVKQLQAALGQSGPAAGAALPVGAASRPPPSAAGAAASAAASAASGASSAAAPIPPAAPAASVPEAANKAGTVIPPSVPPKANGKKKREPSGLNGTAMAAGGVLLLALLGGLAVYLIRRKKIKFSTAPLKVWQGWRKDKKPAEPDVPAAAEEAIPEKE